MQVEDDPILYGKITRAVRATSIKRCISFGIRSIQGIRSQFPSNVAMAEGRMQLIPGLKYYGLI
jgi:hypothetical protein